MSKASALQVLLPTFGSSGDVHPFIALGLELKRRGHTATILTNPLFRDLIEGQELEFLGVGSESEAREAILDPKIWHASQGFGVIARHIGPAIGAVFRLIEARADARTVVACSTLAFGGRLAQEKLGVPCASVHLQPSVLRSSVDQGKLGNLRLSAAHPRWLKRALFNVIDALILDRHLAPWLDAERRRLGLVPVRHVMGAWMHSPQLVLGLFPEWFAPVQPDWPANFHAVGFPLWDLAPPEDWSGAEEFLARGSPPVVVTPGSAGSTMQEFFAQSVRAVLEAGERAMLVTNFPEQLPRHLPAQVRGFGYLPFSRILPRCALLTYHGGIGTLAQTLLAGIPHLTVPHAYDQFDNGWRVARLGLGVSIPSGRYRAGNAASAIRRLIDDPQLRARCEAQSQKIDGVGAAARAADLIESLGAAQAARESDRDLRGAE